MKIPNPLPFDPRPSKAHPEHRQLRKKIEKDSHYEWLPIGILALMGMTLAMNIEKDVKKCEERKSRDNDGGDGADKQRRSRREDDRDRDRGREMERAGVRDGSWERRSRAADRRSYREDCSCDRRSCDNVHYDDYDYAYRPRRRSRESRR